MEKTISEMILVQEEEAVLARLKQINFQDPLKGSSSLMLAVEFNNSLTLIQALVEHGAKVNVQDFVGNTALHLAVIEERVDVVKFLLSKGADAGIKNMDGKTPKELANTDEVRKCF